MGKKCFDWDEFITTINEMSKSQSEILDVAHKWIMKRCYEALKKRDQTIDYVLKNIVRHNAIPEIKGEVTLGKMKWRGIKMYIDTEFNIYFKQRDKIISPKIRHDGTFADDENFGLAKLSDHLIGWQCAEDLINEYEKKYSQKRL